MLKTTDLAGAMLASASMLSIAAAQDTGPERLAALQQQAEADEGDVIVVQTTRQRGATLTTTVEPELTLTESEIAAYGASSIAELLQALAPETSSGRGRRGGGGGPVVLLNGRRISGFREIGAYPPEALARVEVLPEEAALAYGFDANQRVINFVLKPNVIVRAAEGEAEMPDAGGTTATELSAQRLSVNGDRRFSLDVSYSRQSPLFESERDVASEESTLPFASPGNLGADDFGAPIGTILGGDPAATVAALGGADFASPQVGSRNPEDEQDFRSLRAESESWSLGFSRSQGFIDDSVLTLSGQIENAEREVGLGLGDIALDLPSSNPFVPFDDGLTLYLQEPGDGPLLQVNETDSWNVGLSIISKLGRHNWTVTGNYQVAEAETLTDLGVDTSAAQAAIDGGADPFSSLALPLPRLQRLAATEDRTGSLEAVLNGRGPDLPGGPINVSLQGGFFTRSLDTRTAQAADIAASDLSRDTLRAQFNFDLPLIDSMSTWVGSLSINGNANIQELSDAGTLTNLGGGFTWRPSEKVRLLASYTREEGAPGITQLGDPVIVTPNVRVFDFTTGETVLVETTTGGNPDLLTDTRDVLKVGLQLRPNGERDTTLNIDYTQSLLEDEARGFPALTAEIEAAFPERFTRDASGTLVAIDQRPVNFAEGTTRQLRTALNWSKGIERPGGSAGGRPGGPPAAGGRPSGGPPPGTRPGSAPPAGEAQQAEGGRRPVNRQPTRSGRPGRMGLSLTHTWTLEDTLLIEEGLAELDLLGGSAIGDSGGTPEHQVSFTFRRWNNGLGVFAQANWESATEVRGDLTGGSDLRFSDLLLADARIAYDLGFSGAIMQRAPWLRDTRIALGVDNMFNQRREVTNAEGDVPLRFQPDFIDPLGRTFELEIRKRF